MMADSSVFGTIETDNGLQDWSAMTTRLNSFQTFPQVQKVSAERMARAGFYFTGESDRVRCFSCQKIVENWRQGDMPVDRHREVSPACKFLSCAHRRNLSQGHSSQTTDPIYDEELEEMGFRLNTGEIVDETTYPKVPHMKSEEARLRSFDNWPSWSPVRPADLAQAGLFYVAEADGETDRVQCFCCGGMLTGWEEGDDPWAEHTKYYSNCFFILGHDVGNIPCPEQRPMGRYSIETLEGRLDSFRDRQHPISHERLARAGFYSTGEQDRVLCFKCGGGLKDWQINEDPWEEHAKHYPGCSFLLAEKGQEFVNSVQLRNLRSRYANASSNENGFSSHEKESNVMQSEIAQTAIEMGFDPVKVERIILEKMRVSSEGYSKVEDLIHDINNSTLDSDSETEDPLKKLEKLQREKLCKVCMDDDISVVFIPCGHLVTCQKCSKSVEKCPICCAVITQKIKTYSS